MIHQRVSAPDLYVYDLSAFLGTLILDPEPLQCFSRTSTTYISTVAILQLLAEFVLAIRHLQIPAAINKSIGINLKSDL